MKVALGAKDEPSPEVSKRLAFAPLESPYSGVLEACARIREGMALLDKYVGAIERDGGVLTARPQARDDLPFSREPAPAPVVVAPAPPRSEAEHIEHLRSLAASKRRER